MELQEITSPQTQEAGAVAFGLIVALSLAFCVIVGYLFHLVLDRSPRFDETSGTPHPADDVYNPDVWDLAEQYRRDNPERAYFPREGK